MQDIMINYICIKSKVGRDGVKVRDGDKKYNLDLYFHLANREKSLITLFSFPDSFEAGSYRIQTTLVK